MKRQVVIDSSLTLSRIAVVNEGKMVRLDLENHLVPSLQDAIIVGRVEKVIKNLKAAFVQFGADKNGLLHFTQIPEAYGGSIQEGKRLAVQVKRENAGDKGHKLTANLNIKGHCFVCMPFENQICFSKKIKNADKKEQIKELIKSLACEYGVMVRTKAVELPLEELEIELRALIHTTRQVMSIKDTVVPGTVLWQEAPLYWNVISEELAIHDELEVLTNNPQVELFIRNQMEQLNLKTDVQFRAFEPFDNLFKLLGLEKSFDEILKRKVWLKNGGNIMIDYTEAMTIIDVNSAKAILGKNQAKAVLELNELAVEQSIYQILRRNLSGIIIIDLVDLVNKADREQIYEYAKNLLSTYDGRRSKAYPLTQLDLLQIVRTKDQLPHADLLQEPCLICGQKAQKSSIMHMVFKIEQHMKHLASETNMKKVYLKCKAALHDFMKQHALLELLEKHYGMSIEVIVEEDLNENYEIKYHI